MGGIWMKNNILDLVVDIQFLAFAILLRGLKLGLLRI